MVNTIYASLSLHLIGSFGKKWPEYGAREDFWCKGLYVDYYCTHKPITPESCLRYCKGHSQYPRSLRRHYLQPNGLNALQENMRRIANASTCLARVCRIQTDVHIWICGLNLPTADQAKIENNYVENTVDRNQIAKYLADVLYYVIVKS